MAVATWLGAIAAAAGLFKTDNKKEETTTPMRAYFNAAMKTAKEQMETSGHAAASVVRQLQADSALVMTGFLTITLGSHAACMPVTGIIRVQLGVCAQQGDEINDDYVGSYVMNYVEKKGARSQLKQNIFWDSMCRSAMSNHTVASFFEGCGVLQVDNHFDAGKSLAYGLNDDAGNPTTTGKPGLGLPPLLNYFGKLHPTYATVTYDAGFDALPAATAVSTTWRAFSIYANADACAQPTTNTPVFFAAGPVAVMDTCTAHVGCTNLRHNYPYVAAWGETWTEGCITIAPQTSGYMMVTQWTGGDPQQVKRRTAAWTRTNQWHTPHHQNTHTRTPSFFQCTGSIANVLLVATLGQCFAGAAVAGFSPAGVTKVITIHAFL